MQKKEATEGGKIEWYLNFFLKNKALKRKSTTSKCRRKTVITLL